MIDGDAAATTALLPLGRVMRDAIVADLLRSGTFSVSAAVCGQAPTLPGKALAVQARVGQTPLDLVTHQAALHDLSWVVAPETGGLLAMFQRAVGTPRWLGCEAGAIAVASSKRATLLRLAASGVVTPLDFEQGPDINRWVVKPDDGAGAVDTRVHAQRDAALQDLLLRSRAGAAMVVEPWVDGEALSISLLCGRHGSELLSVNRQQIDIDALGKLRYDGVDIDMPAWRSADRRARLQRLADEVTAAIPGLRGFVGVDLVWHAQCGPVVIEVNPRVTCAYAGLSAALGRNLATDVVAAHEMAPQLAHG